MHEHVHPLSCLNELFTVANVRLHELFIGLDWLYIEKPEVVVIGQSLGEA
jgi:hypothetical protein